MTGRRVVAVAALAVVLVVLSPGAASAHPLGDFSVNRYAGLTIGRSEVTLDYVVDTAEIPTFQSRDDFDPDRDGSATSSELRDYAAEECERLSTGIRLAVDDARRSLSVDELEASLQPGRAGLETLRLECLYGARLDGRTGRVAFSDRNFSDRVGWREIVVRGDGTTVTGDAVRSESISDRLTAYPKDRVGAPLDERSVAVGYEPGGAPAPAQPSSAPVDDGGVVAGYDRLTELFTSSVDARRLTVGLALVAIAAAIALGAVHAIAPGHGKTVLAAYLVGRRGSLRHALALGATVAATHTAGVLVLGTVLGISQALAPERVYPWLGIGSGACFAALGATLLFGAVRRRRAGAAGHAHPHVHSHHHGLGHGHHDHDHPHGVDEHGHASLALAHMSWRQLLTLGFAGGMVPTPSAVIVLLGATAIGRAWFGVALVVAYGIGMAATLLAAGLLLVWARSRYELRGAGERMLRVAAVLPFVTAVAVTGGGVLLVVRAAAAM
jgi:ABC-type nickel/cobalt efflux system permease component RcnA